MGNIIGIIIFGFVFTAIRNLIAIPFQLIFSIFGITGSKEKAQNFVQLLVELVMLGILFVVLAAFFKVGFIDEIAYYCWKVVEDIGIFLASIPAALKEIFSK
jgi:hypothetical protein